MTSPSNSEYRSISISVRVAREFPYLITGVKQWGMACFAKAHPPSGVAKTLPLRNSRYERSAQRFLIGWLLLCLIGGDAVATTSRGDDHVPAAQDSAPASAADIDGWVEELSSDSYLLRKRATSNLTRVGEGAVASLVAELDSGDLEITERVIGILQEIAARAPVLAANDVGDGDPSHAGHGAWEELLRISKLGGSRGTRAKVAADEVRDVRRAQAVELLAAAGVFIGIGESTIGAISQQRRIVEVDAGFQGDAAILSLLQWIDGIDYARVRGAAIRQDVLAGVVQMPDLKTLVLLEGEIDADELALLGDIKELRHLELRYVPMNGDLIDRLASLPIRVSLTLNGTAAPADRVAALQKSVPGLEIIFKQGGFLGVKCDSSFSDCLISEVVAGQAAERAGLLPGDVVVEIDGTTIDKFKDLQKAIDAHLPGDTIKIRYQRAGVQTETTAELGKLNLP
ncbi:PDZ domain-containing protein [Allorhodopirellula heiligendammensis]|uniref:PDZ domain-containing protein n=1 Tax=Allorhodopirellula heiligendammensis TaxID=2714739 RepID=UPI00266010C5|nr:PDZ domain-containing protein [Allorhodopirellula heiligendammensis]